MTIDYYRQSRSIYRGPHDEGIGQGRGYPLTRGGDQYLNGTDNDLQDYEFLKPITSWLTLDAKVADYQAINNLEAWCYFNYQQYSIVARMVSAGEYRGRAAYFCHARAFETNAQHDPRLLMGYSDYFDSPDSWPNHKVDISFSEEKILDGWNAILKSPENKARAEKILEHLYLSILGDYPLIIAAPLENFTRNSELFSIIAFAQCALPSQYKQRCNIRFFTRLTLSSLEPSPQLIILPNDSVREAFQQFPKAALLNERGETLPDYTGRLQNWLPEKKDARDYAKAIIANFLGNPNGLLIFNTFTKRFPDVVPNNLISPSYIFANLIGSNIDELFNLILNNPKIEWHKLFVPNDWKKFPTDRLCELALQADLDIHQNTKSLQDSLVSAWKNARNKFDEGFDTWRNTLVQPLSEESNIAKVKRLLDLWRDGLFSDEIVKDLFCEYVLIPDLTQKSQIDFQSEVKQKLFDRKITLDAQLNSWCGSNLDAAKQKRLLDILNTTPDLFSDKNALASLCQEVALSNWLELNVNLQGLLKLEYAESTLENRSINELVLLAPVYSDFLVRLIFERNINALIDQLNDVDVIITILKKAITSQASSKNYKILFFSLCVKLNDLYVSPDKKGFVSEIEREIIRLDPTLSNENKENFFKLANLLSARNADNKLINSASKIRPPEGNILLLTPTFDKDYLCIDATYWIDKDLSFVKQDDVAVKFLTAEAFITKTNIDNLLLLLPIAGSSLTDEQAIQVYQEFTRRWKKNKQETTEKLVANKAMAWFYWYRLAQLEVKEKRDAALMWLCCPLWKEQKAKADLGSWWLAVDNLDCLSDGEIETIFKGGFPRGLFIDWFEQEQLSKLLDLVRETENLDALCALTEAIDKSKYKATFDELFAESPEEKQQVDYLLIESKDVLSFDNAIALLKKSGKRQEKAISYLINSFFNDFSQDNCGYRFSEATSYKLWGEESFIDRLCQFIVDHIYEIDLIERIDYCFPNISATVKDKYKNYASLLQQRNCNKLALFFDKTINETRYSRNTENLMSGNELQVASLGDDNSGINKTPRKTEAQREDFEEKILNFYKNKNCSDNGLFKTLLTGQGILSQYNSEDYQKLADFIFNEMTLFLHDLTPERKKESMNIFIKKQAMLDKLKNYDCNSDRLPIFELYLAFKVVLCKDLKYSTHIERFVEKIPENIRKSESVSSGVGHSFIAIIRKIKPENSPRYAKTNKPVSSCMGNSLIEIASVSDIENALASLNIMKDRKKNDAFFENFFKTIKAEQQQNNNLAQRGN